MEKNIFAQLAAGPFPKTVTHGATIQYVKKFLARGWLDAVVDSSAKGRYNAGQHTVAVIRGVTDAGRAALDK
jgi:hypothetical protein